MGNLLANLNRIQRALDTLAAHHRVPGASLAIWDQGVAVEAVTGIANLNTGVTVTPDTLFQIGSITKLYTTTLIMQLVDEGRVDLESPVLRYIPDFQLADPAAAEAVTVRHLLTHSSGIEGDDFEDFGHNDDAMARFVQSLRHIGQIHPPGERFSYCNTGFVVAGHLIERVTGKPYHEVWRERLTAPLGLSATIVLFQDMLAYRYAVGHTSVGGGPPEVVPHIMMSRTHAPAGSITSAAARDVLRFFAMHLDHGRAPDGTRLLSARSVDAMQTAQYPRPGSPSGHAQVGLGWMLDEWSGQPVIGHDGGTMGQLSFLEILPERGLAVCLLTNANTGGLLWRDLAAFVFSELAGIVPPAVPHPSDEAPRLDLSKYQGQFTRLSLAAEITVQGDVLLLTLKSSGPLVEPAEAEPVTVSLRAVDAERFYLREPDGSDTIAAFSDFDDEGRPQYFFLGRAMRRVK